MPTLPIRPEQKDILITRIKEIDRSIRADVGLEEPRKVLAMAAFALKYLKRHSLAELLHLLDIPHASTVSQLYWTEWGKYLKPFLAQLPQDFGVQDQDASLYALGWLHRLGKTTLSRQTGNQDTKIPKKVMLDPKPEARQGRQAAAPKRIPGRYSIGEQVEVEVVTNNFGTGDVRLTDGSGLLLKNQTVGTKWTVGDTIKGKVTDVQSNGTVRRLKLV